MLQLIIYFIILTLIFSFTGRLALRLMQINEPVHPVFKLIVGMFITMLLIWLLSFFVGFSMFWQGGLLLLAIIFLVFNKSCVLASLFRKFKQWQSVYQVFFFFFVMLTLAVSTTLPLIQDNKTYYIQTIKWVNEQGFVPGLMNLHPFLGQFSGWHILHGLNFGIFNDINAYLTILVLFFAFDKLNTKMSSMPKTWLMSLPLLYIFLVPFLNAPSPDLPVILLSLLVFYLFIENYDKPNAGDIKIMLVLVVFSIMIKLTALPNLLLLFVLLWKYKNVLKNTVKWSISLLLSAFVLVIAKNYILTGYVFYPFTFGSHIWQPEWQYPQEMLVYLGELGRNESFALQANAQVFYDFKDWLIQSDLVQSLMNSSFVFLLLVMPLFIKKQKALQWIYGIGLIYFISILFYAPNFRFFISFYIFFLLIIIEKIIQKWKPAYIIFLITGIVITSIMTMNIMRFNLINIAISTPNTRNRIIKDTEGNLEFYYPNNAEYQPFWETSDAKLPALQRNQLNYFKEYFHYIPQLRKTTLKDGFYSKESKH